ncbi:hypothetical protein QVD17_30417 [Tagetes erecta]|uniref:Uncharacterized protein n=1 Tax=Tagetes erecta TaxID=13708 RepID=A0AAD8K3M2_TARER|nr:hypothetical protein QVD17_30416 [Tagetes erecta]KAK1414668.1 hypothetical protein QVD17_30417 [Tagetes erecta]
MVFMVACIHCYGYQVEKNSSSRQVQGSTRRTSNPHTNARASTSRSRLAALQLAMEPGADHIDVELKGRRFNSATKQAKLLALASFAPTIATWTGSYRSMKAWLPKYQSMQLKTTTQAEGFEVSDQMEFLNQ